MLGANGKNGIDGKDGRLDRQCFHCFTRSLFLLLKNERINRTWVHSFGYYFHWAWTKFKITSNKVHFQNEKQKTKNKRQTNNNNLRREMKTFVNKCVCVQLEVFLCVHIRDMQKLYAHIYRLLVEKTSKEIGCSPLYALQCTPDRTIRYRQNVLALCVCVVVEAYVAVPLTLSSLTFRLHNAKCTCNSNGKNNNKTKHVKRHCFRSVVSLW